MENFEADDSRFIYFSGHRIQKFDWGLDEVDLFDVAIVCADKGVIKDDILFQLLPRKVPQGAKLTAFFDCCHSGTILDLPIIPTSKELRNSATARLKRRLQKILGRTENRKLTDENGKTFLFPPEKIMKTQNKTLSGNIQ